MSSRESADRISKERAMRRRQLKWLWARLKKLAEMEVSREQRLMKLGAARSRAPSAWRLVKTKVDKKTGALTYSLDRAKLRKVRRREGRYLLRTNLTENDPEKLWQYYIQLVAVDIDQAWRLSRFCGWGEVFADAPWQDSASRRRGRTDRLQGCHGVGIGKHELGALGSTAGNAA